MAAEQQHRNFLERLGDRATYSFNKALRSNPSGGGASEATDAPRFRAWGEAYGISATTGPLGLFVGDQRQTVGGVAGLGATVTPGAFQLTKAIPRSMSR